VAYPQTIGVVLAGGLARRMGGGDKTRIRIGMATVLERVIERLRPQCSGLILNANADAARFADTGLRVVADSLPDYAGPLAGILAGLNWTAEHATQIEWIVSVPGDCPFLPRDLVTRLHQARVGASALIACASSAKRPHPVVAIWPVELREDLRRALTRDGVRRVAEWSARYPFAMAAWAGTPVDPFFNINTPEDVSEAERLAARYPDA
jgi:molybdopterin-guanine dinucleotide biosynthesis protein A